MSLKENLGELFNKEELDKLKAHAETMLSTSGMCDHPFACDLCYRSGTSCNWDSSHQDARAFLRWYAEDYVVPEVVPEDPALLMQRLLHARSLLFLNGGCGNLGKRPRCATCPVGGPIHNCNRTKARNLGTALLAKHADVELIIPDGTLPTPAPATRSNIEWEMMVNIKEAQKAYANGFLISHENWGDSKVIHKDIFFGGASASCHGDLFERPSSTPDISWWVSKKPMDTFGNYNVVPHALYKDMGSSNYYIKMHTSTDYGEAFELPCLSSSYPFRSISFDEENARLIGIPKNGISKYLALDTVAERAAYREANGVVLKLGKFLKALSPYLSESEQSTLVEKLGSTVNAHAITDCEVSVESTLMDVYNENHGESGTLGESCMKDKGQLYQQLEDNNVEVVVARDEGGRLKARALLWTFEDGLKFMDRKYYAKGRHGDLLVEHAKDQGWAYKSKDSYGSSEWGYYAPDSEYKEEIKEVLSYPFDLDVSGEMPFLDSFGWGDGTNLTTKSLDTKLTLGFQNCRGQISGLPSCGCCGSGLEIGGDYRMLGSSHICPDCEDQHFRQCDTCGEDINSMNWYSPLVGRYFCNCDCAHTHESCYACHECTNHTFNDYQDADGHQYCGYCNAEVLRPCATCGRLHRRRNRIGGEFYCNDCRDEALAEQRRERNED